jgi:hypothetical protein
MFHCLALPGLLAALPWLLPLSASADPHAAAFVCICTDGTCQACVAAAGAVISPAAWGAFQAQDPVGWLGNACCSSTTFWLHVVLFVAVVPIAVAALGAGYRKHGEWVIPLLGGAGAVLLGMALFWGHQFLDGQGDQVFTVAGSVLLVAAHFWNRQIFRCCDAVPQTTVAG